MTRYLILKAAQEEQALWIEAGTVEAASADGAVRVFAGKSGRGVYAAVPVRSWKPRTVEVAQVTKVGWA